jgi:hypothetical protein
VERLKLTSSQGPEPSRAPTTVPRMMNSCHTMWQGGCSEEKSPPRPVVAQARPLLPRMGETTRSTPPQPTTSAWEADASGAPVRTTATRGRPSRDSSPPETGRCDWPTPHGQHGWAAPMATRGHGPHSGRIRRKVAVPCHGHCHPPGAPQEALG